MQDNDPNSKAHGERIAPERLDAIAAGEGWRRRKVWLFSWADSDEDWPLHEDTPLVENEAR